VRPSQASRDAPAASPTDTCPHHLCDALVARTYPATWVVPGRSQPVGVCPFAHAPEEDHGAATPCTTPLPPSVTDDRRVCIAVGPSCSAPALLASGCNSAMAGGGSRVWRTAPATARTRPRPPAMRPPRGAETPCPGLSPPRVFPVGGPACLTGLPRRTGETIFRALSNSESAYDKNTSRLPINANVDGAFYRLFLFACGPLADN